MTLVDFRTKPSPINVIIGTVKPIVLNALRTVILENFLLCMILSLITAETIIESQHVTNGRADSSPF
jgi:hypothetical protein